MGVEIRAILAERRKESPEAATLKLDLGGAPFSYRPGQYILIDPGQFEALSETLRRLERERGRPESPRPFSLASDGLDPGSVEITVKENPRQGEYGMLVSPLLVRGLPVGSPIRFKGPAGRYALPEAPPPGIAGFLHVCSGSGVAPNRGMIRHALGKGWPHRHLLACQDRTEEDVIYKEEWKQLLSAHPDRLRVVRAFSASQGKRLDPGLLRDAMAGWIDVASAMAFVCGPTRRRGTEPGFVEFWAGALPALGVAAGRTVTEKW